MCTIAVVSGAKNQPPPIALGAPPSSSVTEQAAPEQRYVPVPPPKVPAKSRPTSPPSLVIAEWVIEPFSGAASSSVERMSGSQPATISSPDAGTVSPVNPLTSRSLFKFSGTKGMGTGAPTSL